MKIMFKAFRELDDGTLRAVYAPTIYKVGKTKVFKKCPAFAVKDISSLTYLATLPRISVWKVAVDGKVEVPKYLLPTKELTRKKMNDFWNGKIPGSLKNFYSFGYLKIKPIRKVAVPDSFKFRKL